LEWKLRQGNFDVATYEFECDDDIFGIKASLNRAGPWEWRANDGDFLGTYLSTHVRVSPESGEKRWTRLRIAEEGSSFKIQVDFCRDLPDNILTYEQINEIALKKLLPTIRARNIRKTESID
jgi:hypothetical protein